MAFGDGDYDDATGLGGGGMQSIPGQGPMSPGMMAQGQQFGGIGGNTGPGTPAPQGPGLWSQLGQNFQSGGGFSKLGQGLMAFSQANNPYNQHPALAQDPGYQLGQQHGMQNLMNLFKKIHEGMQKGGSVDKGSLQQIASMNPMDLQDSESQ